MFCRECGKELTKKARYCLNCGVELDEFVIKELARSEEEEVNVEANIQESEEVTPQDSVVEATPQEIETVIPQVQETIDNQIEEKIDIEEQPEEKPEETPATNPEEKEVKVTFDSSILEETMSKMALDISANNTLVLDELRAINLKMDSIIELLKKNDERITDSEDKVEKLNNTIKSMKIVFDD